MSDLYRRGDFNAFGMQEVSSLDGSYAYPLAAEYLDHMIEEGALVPVEPVETNEVWWCKTHGIGQHYDGEGPWWHDEWAEYVCAIKAEYPVEGECVPLRVLIVEADDE